mmetsp:Transcript_36430/g.58554  ORF Transcript_36430/g.58554 Transcript_36430/m.58554 type:complete len:169 (-) Transcript_36430:105-611(-)
MKYSVLIYSMFMTFAGINGDGDSCIWKPKEQDNGDFNLATVCSSKYGAEYAWSLKTITTRPGLPRFQVYKSFQCCKKKDIKQYSHQCMWTNGFTEPSIYNYTKPGQGSGGCVAPGPGEDPCVRKLGPNYEWVDGISSVHRNYWHLWDSCGYKNDMKVYFCCPKPTLRQ